MKNFTVISSNPNKTGGFVTKLYSEQSKETVFGTKTVRETYYVSGTKQLVKDTVVPLDLSEWRIAKYPFEAVDEDGVVTKMELNWLHLKA